ncbi:MAG TPA: hypothetical protein VEN82_05605 [Actinomycetota bacterium]|nr:hypothetical protein [Actinomycetota bacterium]
MAKVTITATLLDETRIETTSRTYMCLADRAAFERQFDVGSGALMQLADLFDAKGERRAGADLGNLREEWMAFLAWRCLNRDVGDQGPFLEFLDRLDSIEIVEQASDGEAAAADPLDPAPIAAPGG